MKQKVKYDEAILIYQEILKTNDVAEIHLI